MSDANVVKLEIVEVGMGHKVEPNAVLAGARDHLIKVVVCGLDESGELYVAASHHGPDSIWLIEKAKALILRA